MFFESFLKVFFWGGGKNQMPTFILIADIYEHASKEKIPSVEKKKSKKSKKISQPVHSFQKKRKKRRNTKRAKKKIPSPSSASSTSGSQEKTDRITPTSHFLNNVLPERSPHQILKDTQPRDEQNKGSTPPGSCLPPLIKTIKKKFKKNLKQNSFNAAGYLKKIIENILREALEKKADSM